MNFSIRSMIILISIIAIFFGLLKFVSIAIPGLSDRTWALSSGQNVVVVEDHEASVLIGNGPISRNDFYTMKFIETSRLHLKAGTLATVSVDSGDDDDTEGRSVAVKLLSGVNRGLVVIVSRGSIRER
jgi:hypothetical protein